MPTNAEIATDWTTISLKLFLAIVGGVSLGHKLADWGKEGEVFTADTLFLMIDDEIAEQISYVDELTGSTIDFNPTTMIPESYDTTIDRILQEGPTTTSTRDIPVHPLDIGIPDSLDEMMSTPVDQNISNISLSSILRMSAKMRSSRRARTFDRFRNPTPKSGLKQDSGGMFCREQCPVSPASPIAAAQQPMDRQASYSNQQPLSLFDLSGSIPATAQVFQVAVPDGRFSESAYSFRSLDDTASMLVPATQHTEHLPPDTASLLPTTPTATVENIPTAAGSSSFEIPPTQQHIGRKSVGSGLEMSQMDLFSGAQTETTTTTDIPASIFPRESVSLPSTIELPETPDEEHFSGHETVLLPDSFDDDDEEDNPFTDKQSIESSIPTISPISSFSSIPTIASSIPTIPSSAAHSLRRISEPPMLPSQLPVEEYTVPRTGKKVRFAPTPEDSSQPPPPATISIYRHHQRTDTQEMEESFATSLSRLCRPILTVPRNDVSLQKTPTKPSVTDVEERIMAEGVEMEMNQPKTPLKIVTRQQSRQATPLTTKAVKLASTPTTTKAVKLASTPTTTKTLSMIIKAIGTSREATPTAKANRNKDDTNTPMKRILENVARDVECSSTKRKKVAEPVKSKHTMVLDSDVLGEGLLVWAQWRLQYFTVGVVGRKKSKSREIWQVRPLHRHAPQDLSSEHLLPLSSSLSPGDPLLHITDRRSYKFTKKTFKCFDLDPAENHVIRFEDGSSVGLEGVLLDRNLFAEKHRAWKSRNIEDTHQETIVAMEKEIARPSRSISQAEGLFTGLSFILTGSQDKSKLASTIKEHGGAIIEDLTPATLHLLDTSKVILIAAAEGVSTKTVKYYCSILLGIDRLNPSWIDSCISKGKLVPRKAHRCDSLQTPPPSTLFTDIHISFVGSRAWKDSCTQIAAFTSATIVDQRRLAACKDRSVVVVLEAAGLLKPRLQATCLSNGHLIADKNWFTDSIIQGKVIDIS